ncbi:MAG TPA: sporulation protein [Chondromyces sp.]|nr:sporulation protein [Chondromyces sp.]
MSFFNKMLASFGIGAAKVDTKLEKSSFTAGERIRGAVEVRGGSVGQQIDSIYLTLFTTYIRESDDKKYTDYAAIVKTKINEPFHIGPNELRSFPFEIRLPEETPITYGNTRVWVATGLDIKNAVDPQDKDYIEVRPSELAGRILEEIELLGFRLRQVECEQASSSMRSRYPFVQEFEFIPVSGPFRGRLDELEVVFISQSSDRAELILEVDRRARGFGGFLAEAFEMDESLVRLSIATNDLPNLRSILQQTIERFS